MTYSTAHVTGNAADHGYDSDNLLRFAYNHAKGNLVGGLSCMLEGSPNDWIALGGVIGTPLVFAWHLIMGPFLYQNPAPMPHTIICPSSAAGKSAIVDIFDGRITSSELVENGNLETRLKERK